MKWIVLLQGNEVIAQNIKIELWIQTLIYTGTEAPLTLINCNKQLLMSHIPISEVRNNAIIIFYFLICTQNVQGAQNKNSQHGDLVNHTS